MPLSDILGPAFGAAGSAVGAFGIWHAARTKTAADREGVSRDDARDDERAIDDRWQAMLDNQRKDFDTILGPIRGELAELRAEVQALRRMQSDYLAALDHIRSLRAWGETAQAPTPMPPLPAALTDKLV